MSTVQDQSAMTAIRVPEEDRLKFLPAHFGRSMIIGETLVYSWMDRLCPHYTGGYWDFFEVTNGAFYMAPAESGPMRIQVPGNGFDGLLSVDAAGIVATMFALNHLAAVKNDAAEAEPLIEAYHGLMAFAGEHREADQIFQAID